MRQHSGNNTLPRPHQQRVKYGEKRIGNADYGTNAHCVHRLLFHIVFVTKFRRQLFAPNKLKYIKEILPRIAHYDNYNLIEINGEADHIHLILQISPAGSVGVAVGRLKSVSAKMFLNRYGAQFWGNHVRTLWNSGYFVASTGGVTLDVLRKYVETQGTS